MQNFVEKVTKTTILETIDGVGPNCSLVSIVPFKPTAISLVIGAFYRDKAPSESVFTKGGLKELIYTLQEVHDAME